MNESTPPAVSQPSPSQTLTDAARVTSTQLAAARLGSLPSKAVDVAQVT